MGARLQGDFYSFDGNKYTVTLDEVDYAGAPSDFNIRSLQIRYKGGDNNLHAPILASSCQIDIAVQSSGMETFLANMAGAAEETYRLKIEKNDTLFWAGVVVSDQVVLEDRKTPYTFSITALDGLGRLQKKDYKGTGATWSGWQTFLVHLHNVLSLIGVDDFWSSEDYIRLHSTLFSLGPTGEDYNTNPIPIHRFNHKAFQSIDSNGNLKYASAYDVLAAMCKAFTARLYLADGAYHFEQVNSYARTDASIVIFPYSVTLGAQTAVTLDNWGDRRKDVDRSAVRLAGNADTTVTSGTVNRYLSALNRVEVAYKHYATRSLSTASNTWTNASSTSLLLGEVENDPAKILLQIPFTYKVAFTTSGNAMPGRLKFRFRIEVSDGTDIYYCSRPARYLLGSVVYDDPTWVQNTLSYVEFYTESAYFNDNEYTGQFNLTTPVVPVDGELSLGITYLELQATNEVIANSGSTAHTVTWSFTNARVEILLDGVESSNYNTSTFESTNTATTNSDELKIDMLLGDGPANNAFGRMQVFNGTNWVNSSLWTNYPETEGRPHSALLAREVLAARQAPVKIIDGTLRGVLGAQMVIDRSGERFLFMGGTINLIDDTVDGTWAFIARVPDNTSTSSTPTDTVDNYDGWEEVVIEEIDPTPTPPPNPGPDISPAVEHQAVDGFIFTTSGRLTTGLVSSVTVDETADVHPFQTGDGLFLLDPYTGNRQAITVAQNESNKTIAIDSVTLSRDFPEQSVLVVPQNFLLQLLNKLRRFTIDFQLMGSSTEVYRSMTFPQFWRVPARYNGYLLTSVLAAVETSNGGTMTYNVTATVAGTAYTVNLTGSETHDSFDIQAANYQTLATGDLVTFSVTYSPGSGSNSKGLIVQLELIATV